MRYYYREKDYLYIGFDYRPYLVAAMKKFKANYNIATKEWYIQLGLGDTLQLKGFLEENGFEHKKVILPRDIELVEITPSIDEDLLREI